MQVNSINGSYATKKNVSFKAAKIHKSFYKLLDKMQRKEILDNKRFFNSYIYPSNDEVALKYHHFRQDLWKVTELLPETVTISATRKFSLFKGFENFINVKNTTPGRKFDIFFIERVENLHDLKSKLEVFNIFKKVINNK